MTCHDDIDDDQRLDRRGEEAVGAGLDHPSPIHVPAIPIVKPHVVFPSRQPSNRKDRGPDAGREHGSLGGWRGSVDRTESSALLHEAADDAQNRSQRRTATTGPTAVLCALLFLSPAP